MKQYNREEVEVEEEVEEEVEVEEEEEEEVEVEVEAEAEAEAEADSGTAGSEFLKSSHICVKNSSASCCLGAPVRGFRSLNCA